MKFNFYISCDTAEEAQQCIKFIDKMTSNRGKTWLDQVEEKEPISGRESSPSPAAQKVDNEEIATSHPTTRTNVSPGEPSIGKIGNVAKDAITATLGAGRQPAEKYTEHMKLLWKRGEVKYDGKEYYL